MGFSRYIEVVQGTRGGGSGKPSSRDHPVAGIRCPLASDSRNVAKFYLPDSRRRMPFYSGRFTAFSGNIASPGQGSEVKEVKPGILRARNFTDEKRGDQAGVDPPSPGSPLFAGIRCPRASDCRSVAKFYLPDSRRRMPFCSGRITAFSGNIASPGQGSEAKEVKPGILRARNLTDEKRGNLAGAGPPHLPGPSRCWNPMHPGIRLTERC